MQVLLTSIGFTIFFRCLIFEFLFFTNADVKEVQIVYRLFLVNCHLLHMPRHPSKLASNISMNACVQVFTNSTAQNPK